MHTNDLGKPMYGEVGIKSLAGLLCIAVMDKVKTNRTNQ